MQLMLFIKSHLNPFLEPTSTEQ